MSAGVELVLRSVEDLARHKELKSRDLQSELVQQSKVTPQQVCGPVARKL